ncbi:hypothetical protein LEMLEM_LOCUS20863 [Lemmus lemmus]
MEPHMVRSSSRDEREGRLRALKLAPQRGGVTVCFTSGYVKKNRRWKRALIKFHFRSDRSAVLQYDVLEVSGPCTQVNSTPCGDIRLRARPRVPCTRSLSVTPAGGPGHSAQWPRRKG